MNKESLIDFDKYEITKDGKIFSKRWKRYMTELISKTGYTIIGLVCTDGKQRLFRLNRVIWYYFNGEIPEGLQVNHIDENKQNNALFNLNLMTPKQNSNWGSAIQRSAEKRRNNQTQSKEVYQIDKTTNEVIAVFPSTHEIERQLGFANQNISNCCNGKYNTAYGFKWSYTPLNAS